MIRLLRILSWRAAVPVSAFACGTLLGWVVTPLLFVLVPLGALLGYALGAAAAWGAFRVGERAAPDRSRGSPRAILASSLVFLILGGLPAAGLVAALTSIGPNPPGLAEAVLSGWENGPLLYLVPAAMFFVAIGATLATWRFRSGGE